MLKDLVLISQWLELVPVVGHCLSVVPQVDWALLSPDVHPDGTLLDEIDGDGLFYIKLLVYMGYWDLFN